jgi:hypothetical protein
MEIIGSSSFEPDRKFESLDKAAEFLMHEYVQELPAQVWREQPSGLLIPELAPKYLFRGESGHYPTTVAGSYRPSAYSLRDGRQLTQGDLDAVGQLIPSLADRFSGKDYSVDAHSAIGLLQHYGLPTWLIDFTSHALEAEKQTLKGFVSFQAIPYQTGSV